MKNENALKIGLEGKALFYPVDSAGLYTYNLIKHLSIIEKIHRFYVYFNHAPLFKKNLLDFKQHNIILNRYSLFPSSPKLLDVYHDTCFCFSGIKTNAKKIISVNSIAPIILPDLFTKSDFIFFKRNIETIDKNFNFIITPTQSAKNDLAAHLKINPAKITVIPAGIPAYFKKSTKYEIELALSRYRVKRPYILFVGTLEDKKNIYRLIEAYSKLKYESPPQLVLIGACKSMKHLLKNIIVKFGMENNIKYLGYIPNRLLAPLYSGAELFIYPSLNTGYGFSLLEALSCEVPVISSQIPSVCEITGDAALLADPWDVSKITAAIKNALSKDYIREDIRKKGLNRVADFSLKSSAQATLALYKHASGKKL